MYKGNVFGSIDTWTSHFLFNLTYFWLFCCCPDESCPAESDPPTLKLVALARDGIARLGDPKIASLVTTRTILEPVLVFYLLSCV